MGTPKTYRVPSYRSRPKKVGELLLCRCTVYERTTSSSIVHVRTMLRDLPNRIFLNIVLIVNEMMDGKTIERSLATTKKTSAPLSYYLYEMFFWACSAYMLHVSDWLSSPAARAKRSFGLSIGMGRRRKQPILTNHSGTGVRLNTPDQLP